MKSPGNLTGAKFSPGYMDSILGSSCEQLCVSFPTPPPRESEVFKREKSEAKIATPICPSVQSPVKIQCHISPNCLTLKYCWRPSVRSGQGGVNRYKKQLHFSDQFDLQGLKYNTLWMKEYVSVNNPIFLDAIEGQ